MSNISEITYYLSDGYSYSGSQPVPQADVDNEPGWQYKSNLVGQQLKVLAYDGSSQTFKYSNIGSCGFEFKSFNVTISRNPRLIIQSKPTGSGDADPLYHSKWVFELSDQLHSEELITCFSFNPPFQYDNKRMFQLVFNDTLSQGDRNVYEEISKIYIETDSTVDNHNLLLKNFVINSAGLINNYSFQRTVNYSAGDINLEVLKEIEAPNNRDGYAQVLLTSAGGTAVKADTTCVVQKDTENRTGWNCVNSVAGTKFNFYIFNGLEENFRLDEINSVYWRGYVNRYTGVSSVPFLQIYTKPQGAGDGGAFFRTRINYTYNPALDDVVGIGEEIVYYGENLPDMTFTNRKVKLSSKVVLGPNQGSEEVLFVVVASDSGATVDTMNSTVNLVGFNNTKVRRNFNLLTSANEISVGNQDTLSVAQQVLVYGKNGLNLHPLKIDTVGRLITFSEDIRSAEVNIVTNQTVGANADIGSSINCGTFKFINIYGSGSGNHSIRLFTSSDNVNFYFMQEIYPNTVNGNYEYYVQTSEQLQYVKLVNSNTSNTFTLNYTLSN